MTERNEKLNEKHESISEKNRKELDQMRLAMMKYINVRIGGCLVAFLVSLIHYSGA